MSQKVYLDYAASTPVDTKVLEAMKPYWQEIFANPSSIHQAGQQAREAIEQAREKVASFLGCQAKEIIFTSGATEANNLALRGVMKALKKTKQNHLITTNIEHHSVGCVAEVLKKVGLSVDLVRAGKDGLVSVDDIKEKIRPETGLISIMYVNNEIGAIQPIKEIGAMIAAENKTRSANQRIYFHTDAVQALNYLNCLVADLGVDLLSLSGHKIYGPKGIGALYIRQGTLIKPVQYGGEHERGLRAGTYNTPGIVGLGAAVELLTDKDKQTKETTRLRQLRDKLMAGIQKAIPDAQINGCLNQRIVNNINISFPRVEGESLLLLLDEARIFVSTGSACSSASLAPSHVLQAIGLSPERTHSSLRLTLGKLTTEAEIDYVLSQLPLAVEKLQKMSPS